MLNIEQFRCGDNLSYLLYAKKQAIAIDGVATREIVDFLTDNFLELMIVTNTHSHYDHTSGNDELCRYGKAKLLDFGGLTDDTEISMEGGKIFVWWTPGHTFDSVCFYTGSALISGDTLFNGTVGNCFTGDLKSFYISLKRLMALPDETIIYAGHDYVQDSLAFAKRLEPDNKYIDEFRNYYDSGHVCSTLAEERRINPYLRFNEESIVKLLKERGLPWATEWERWTSLMSID